MPTKQGMIASSNKFGEVFIIMDKHDIVKVEMPHNFKSSAPQATATKAVQLRVDQNKSVIIYNKASGYIVEALLKAVFDHAH